MIPDLIWKIHDLTRKYLDFKGFAFDGVQGQSPWAFLLQHPLNYGATSSNRNPFVRGPNSPIDSTISNIALRSSRTHAAPSVRRQDRRHPVADEPSH